MTEVNNGLQTEGKVKALEEEIKSETLCVESSCCPSNKCGEIEKCARKIKDGKESAEKSSFSI